MDSQRGYKQIDGGFSESLGGRVNGLDHGRVCERVCGCVDRRADGGVSERVDGRVYGSVYRRIYTHVSGRVYMFFFTDAQAGLRVGFSQAGLRVGLRT